MEAAELQIVIFTEHDHESAGSNGPVVERGLLLW
jgi:hypothetical protein